jgi:hypothetical protein
LRLSRGGRASTAGGGGGGGAACGKLYRGRSSSAGTSGKLTSVTIAPVLVSDVILKIMMPSIMARSRHPERRSVNEIQ